MINTSKDPFRCWLRRESPTSGNLVLRFEMDEGKGILSLRASDRRDPDPSSVYEEAAIPAEALRMGRLVHVLSSGMRQSFSLARLAEDVTLRFPHDAWVELKSLSEFGFRYLVPPDEVAAGAVIAPAGPAAAQGRVAAQAAPRATMPTAAISEAALRALSQDQAIAVIREEMAKVAGLLAHVSNLERALAQSQGRERDLIEMLARWRGLDDVSGHGDQ